MVKLQSYSVITKPQDDLLTKGFCFANHFGLVLKESATKGIRHKASIAAVKKDGVSSFNTKAHTERRLENGLLLKLDLNALQHLKVSGEYLPPDNPKVKLSTEVSGELGKPDSIKAALTTEFTADKLRTRIGISKGPEFKLTGVFGEENIGIGFNLVVDALAGRLSKYNWLIYWTDSANHLALKHVSSDAKAYKIGDLKLSYYTSLTAKTAVAAELSAGFTESSSSLKVGFQHEFSSAFTGKLRLDDKGNVATSMHHVLSDWTRLTTSTSLNFSRGLSRPFFDLGFKLTVSN